MKKAILILILSTAALYIEEALDYHPWSLGDGRFRSSELGRGRAHESARVLKMVHATCCEADDTAIHKEAGQKLLFGVALSLRY